MATSQNPGPGPEQQRVPAVLLETARGERARRRLWISAVVAVAIGAALTAAVVVELPALMAFDLAVHDTTRGWADSLGWPVDVAAVIGAITQPLISWLVATIVVVGLILVRRPIAAILVTASALLGVLLTDSAKLLVGRQRPPGAEVYQADVTRSFPSGHASSGIYLYLALGLVALRFGHARHSRGLVGLGWLLIVFGPLLGVTRIILGVHWASDVAAGWIYGSVALMAAALLLWRALGLSWAGRAD